MAKFFVNIVSQSYKSSNTGVALSRWGGLSNVNKKGSSRVSEMSSLTHFSWKWLICVFIIVFKVQHIAMSSHLIFSRFSCMGNIFTRWFFLNVSVDSQFDCKVSIQLYNQFEGLFQPFEILNSTQILGEKKDLLVKITHVNSSTFHTVIFIKKGDLIYQNCSLKQVVYLFLQLGLFFEGRRERNHFCYFVYRFAQSGLMAQ